MRIGIGVCPGVSGATQQRAAWNPVLLSGLVAWFYGDDAEATITAAEYDSIPNQGSLGNSFDDGAAKPDAVTIKYKSAPNFQATESLLYSGAAADFEFLHSPAGEATITVRVEDIEVGAHTILCTSRSGLVGAGGVWLYRPSADQAQFRIIKADGTNIVALQTQYCLAHDTLTIVRDADSVEQYVNGEYQGTAAIVGASTGAPTFAMRIGNAEVGSAPLLGTVPELIIQNVADTYNMDRRINWLHERWGTGPNVVAAGNSLTVGQGSTFSPSKNWVRQMDLSSLGKPMLRRIATSGRTTPQLTAEIASLALPKFIGDRSDVLVIYEAGNDMSANGVTPAQAWANVVAYREEAVIAGWSGAVATCTIGPRSDLDTVTEVDAFNALVRANWAAEGFAFIADFGDDAGLAVPAADGVHYNDAQYLTIAGYFEAQILTWFARPALSSATVDESGYRVTLTYAEALDEAYVPDASDFSVAGTGVNGTPVTDSVVVSGSTVYFDLSLPVGETRTVTVSYTPGATKLRRVAGSGADAAALTAAAVTNGSLLVAAYDLSFGVTQAAGLISQIDDASGEGNHQIQATDANKRQYNATGLGGLPTADSDTANRYMRITALAGGTIAQPTWIMHALTWSTVSGRACDGYDAGAGRQIMSGNGTNAQVYSGSFAGSAGQPADAAPTIFDAEFNSPNSRFRLESHGAALVEQTGLTSGTQSLVGYQLGGGAGAAYRGGIGRSLAYRGPVSAGAKEIARQRARNDFGIVGI